jgi:hypothetical protein
LRSLALSAVDEGMMTAESFFVTHGSALLTTADPGGLWQFQSWCIPRIFTAVAEAGIFYAALPQA